VRAAEVEIVDPVWQKEQERQLLRAELQEQEQLKRRIRGNIAIGAFVLLVAFCCWMFATRDRRRAARLEREKRARQEREAAAAAEARAREQEEAAKRRAGEQLRLIPNCPLLSSSPIARGEEVMVKVEGTYTYTAASSDIIQYADSHYTWSSGMAPGNYLRYDALFFDDSTVSSKPFREERHLHTYWYLYTGTGQHMSVFLRRPFNFSYYYHQDAHLTITLAPLSEADAAFLRSQAAAQAEHEEERQRQLEEEAAAQEREEAEALEAERHDRFRAIQARYGDELLAWRNDDAALSRYAREHRNELLSQKDMINSDYDAFHTEDLDFADWLRINHSELFYRVDEVFYYRVRALAESLPKEEPPPPKPRRPKLSPEERQAKFERYRARALERDRIQAEDRMAAVRQKLGLLQQFRDDLDAYDLDEDERDRLIKEFEDDLFAQPEEDFDGTFKQL
jgi:hypothetical protein